MDMGMMAVYLIWLMSVVLGETWERKVPDRVDTTEVFLVLSWLSSLDGPSR